MVQKLFTLKAIPDVRMGTDPLFQAIRKKIISDSIAYYLMHRRILDFLAQGQMSIIGYTLKRSAKTFILEIEYREEMQSSTSCIIHEFYYIKIKRTPKSQL